MEHFPFCMGTFKLVLWIVLTSPWTIFNCLNKPRGSHRSIEGSFMKHSRIHEVSYRIWVLSKFFVNHTLFVVYNHRLLMENFAVCRVHFPVVYIPWEKCYMQIIFCHFHEIVFTRARIYHSNELVSRKPVSPKIDSGGTAGIFPQILKS